MESLVLLLQEHLFVVDLLVEALFQAGQLLFELFDLTAPRAHDILLGSQVDLEPLLVRLRGCDGRMQLFGLSASLVQSVLDLPKDAGLLDEPSLLCGVLVLLPAELRVQAIDV